jgi:hypothetical protein
MSFPSADLTNTIEVGDSVNIGIPSVKTTENKHIDNACSNQQYKITRYIKDKNPTIGEFDDISSTLGAPNKTLESGQINCGSQSGSVYEKKLNTITIETDDLRPGQYVCYILSVRSWTNDPYHYKDARPDNMNGVGVDNGQWRNDSVCVQVTKTASVHIRGADAWAGSSTTAGICNKLDNKADTGFESTTPRNNSGSWGQYGLFTPGNISVNFGSGGRTSWTASSGNSLEDLMKFANTPQLGNFTASHCATNMWSYYYNQLPKDIDVIGQGESVDTAYMISSWAEALARAGNSAVTENVYYSDGNLTIDSVVTLGANQRIVLVVNGDVTINQNIMYGSGYNSIYEIPNLTIIATNIIINPNVHQLAGVYVVSGIFWDCGDGRAANDSAFNYEGICAKGNDNSYSADDEGLTLSGALITGGLRLQRTNGTKNISDAKPAEVIQYTPALYLQDYAQKVTIQKDIKTILTREVAPRF